MGEEPKKTTIIEISGPPEALAELLAKFKSGELTELAGHKILAIDPHPIPPGPVHPPAEEP